MISVYLTLPRTGLAKRRISPLTSGGALLLLPLMLMLGSHAQAAVTPINLSGPVSDWDVIMKGSAFDPGNDQQASSNPGVDIVGTDFDATLFTIYDDKGTAGDTSDDDLAFRVRVGGANAQSAFGGYMWIGIDVDLDGDLDAFIGMNGNGKTGTQFSGDVVIYEAGTGLNTSPSSSSATNPVTVAALADNGTNFSFDTVDSITDPSASATDINLDSKTDRFVSFKVSWSAIRAAINAKPLTDPSGDLIGTLNGGAGLTYETPIAYTLSTSTNSNNVNSDVGGYDNKNDDLSVSYVAQGALSPPLSFSNIFPVINSDSGGDAATLNIYEGTTSVTTVTATDANGDPITYAISGGVDAAFFTISGGALSFISAPSFASANDDDNGNDYLVTVSASDGRGGLDTQALTVIVDQVSGDVVAPEVVSVERLTPLAELTNANSLTFRVGFNEAVQNVSSDDFVASGTAATGASISGVLMQSADVYDVTVTGISNADGTLGLGFDGAQNIADNSANPLTNVSPSGANQSYTLDNQAPTLSGAEISSADITLTYDELLDSASTPVAGDVVVRVNGTPVTVNSIAVSGNQVVVTLAAAVSDTDTVTLSYTVGAAPISDQAGNTASALTEESVLNNTGDVLNPTVVSVERLQPLQALVNADSLVLRVVFSEVVENVNAADFVANGTAASGAVISAVAVQSGSVYDVTVTGVDNANGTLGLGFDAAQDIADTSANSLTSTTPTGANQSYTLDNQAPDAALVTAISTDTGASGTDGNTYDQELVISGTAEPNSSVEIFLNGSSIGVVSADGSGAWTLDYSATTLAEGGYTLKAQASDEVGNVGTVGAPFFNIVVDITDPVVASFDQDSKTLIDDTPALTGTAEAGAAVVVNINDVNYSTVADGSGNWSVNVSPALANSSYAVTVTTTDLAGNSSLKNGSVTVNTALDSDNDGIPDSVEGTVDSDTDGTPDYLDTDSDDDGILDSVEGTVQTDTDGIANYLDLDSDDDGKLDEDEGTADEDGDGIANYIDADDSDGPTGDPDGDGLTNQQEDTLGSNGDDDDTDGDGIKDGEEVGGDTSNPKDSDGDGIPDYLDPDDIPSDSNGNDSDNDGIADDIECPDFAGSGCPDSDGDDLPDYLDDDDDNDGIPTLTEGSSRDTDGNGVPDYLDADDDGDGTLTQNEDGDGDFDGNPATAAGPDADGDGIPAYLDPNDGLAGMGDADGDGLTDDQECTSLPCQDSDNDGTPDYMDADDDNDGIDTADEDLNENGDPRDEDTDGDGTPDYLDTDDDGDGTNTADESSSNDTDGDGIPDYLDGDSANSAGTADNSGDSDGDGLSDALECPTGVPCQDTDNDGTPDYMDVDDDGDGVNTSDEDVDGNGDPRDDDSDNDGTPDYLDTDDDNDGVPTSAEGDGDSDGDNIPDYLDPDTGDSDGDGLGDGIECPGGVPCPDSDDDGYADFIDPDDDNDGINTADEDLNGNGDARDDDSDGDGTPDYLDTDDDNDGIPSVTEGVVDTDGDGIPDYLDVDAGNGAGSEDGSGDSDGDGLSDKEECPDFAGAGCPDSDGDGIADYLDPRVVSTVRGAVKTGLHGAGSAPFAMLSILVALGLLRRRRAALALLALLPGITIAVENGSVMDSLEQNGYLGLGLGMSILNPDAEDAGYRVDDKHDLGVLLIGGYQFTSHWAADLIYADLGAADLSARQPGLKQHVDASYRFSGLSGLYYLKGYQPDDRGLDFFGRLGIGALQANTGGTQEDVENHTQIYFGIGAEKRWSKGWALRAEAQTFDADASLVSVAIVKRFGGGRTTTQDQTHSEPVEAEQSPVAVLAADADFDGVPDDADRCPDTAAGMEVDKSGCALPLDSDGDGVNDDQDACPDTSPDTAVDALGCDADFALEIKNILFASGSAELTEKGRQAVANVAEVFAKTNQDIDVVAHTDSVGATAVNQALSERRAAAVVETLVSEGISRSRLRAFGRGESEPVADNATSEGRAANRRVDFVLREKQLIEEE